MPRNRMFSGSGGKGGFFAMGKVVKAQPNEAGQGNLGVGISKSSDLLEIGNGMCTISGLLHYWVHYKVLEGGSMAPRPPSSLTSPHLLSLQKREGQGRLKTW